MVKTILVASKSNHELQNYVGVDGTTCLGVMTFAQANGHFNSEYRSSAGTSILIPVRGKDAINITDIMIMTDKVNAATVTVIVTDGVESEQLAAADVTNAPVAVALAMQGRWESWQGTWVELVTTGVVKANVSIGYYRVPEGTARTYAVWNSER